MARMRTVKPGFFTNDLLGTLPMSARLLFIGIWTVSDREGRVLDRPRKLKVELLPYDKVNVDRLLDSLTEAGFIQRYVSDSGMALIQVVNWPKHQQPHVKEAASTLPAPNGHPADTVRKPPLTGVGVGVGVGMGVGAEAVQDGCIFRLYEQEIGTITPAIRDTLLDWETRIPLEPEGERTDRFVEYAFKEAALNGARSWRYVETVLKRLESEKWPLDLWDTPPKKAAATQSHGLSDADIERRQRANEAKVAGRDDWEDELLPPEERDRRQKAHEAKA